MKTKFLILSFSFLCASLVIAESDGENEALLKSHSQHSQLFHQSYSAPSESAISSTITKKNRYCELAQFAIEKLSKTFDISWKKSTQLTCTESEGVEINHRFYPAKKTIYPDYLWLHKKELMLTKAERDFLILLTKDFIEQFASTLTNDHLRLLMVRA